MTEIQVLPFAPIQDGESIEFDRRCKCRTAHECCNGKPRWKRVARETFAEQVAFKALFEYLHYFRPEIYEAGIVEDEYAFYRVVRV